LPNVQASYSIPGAIEIVPCLIGSVTRAIGPGEAAGSAAGAARCAIASASAFAGAIPAKLGDA